ncbi:hypothetical protein TNCV_4376051 [Trichonephila clavipes]|nr:hypothetical protein TNCV_4376051 [Trichonephila clavipes]
MPAHHDTACRISVLFLDIFWTISSTTLAPDQLASSIDDRLNLLLRNSTHAPVCSVQLAILTTPLQTGSTVLSGQWDTQQVCVRIVLLPQTSGFNVFGDLCFPEAARN